MTTEQWEAHRDVIVEHYQRHGPKETKIFMENEYKFIAKYVFVHHLPFK